jgi:hypothetical protein
MADPARACPVADYHCAHAVFTVIGALDALNDEEIT